MNDYNRLFIDPFEERAADSDCVHILSTGLLALDIRVAFSTHLQNNVQHTRVRFACLFHFSRDQSSMKLIIFLNSKLEKLNLRVAKLDTRLDS